MAIRKPCALVLGAMLVVGCHESPQAPSGTSSSTFVTLSLRRLAPDRAVLPALPLTALPSNVPPDWSLERSGYAG